MNSRIPFLGILFLIGTSTLVTAAPHIAVLIVVDQLAEHILSCHRPMLTGGIKRLFTEGMYFAGAYHPHSQPETATGHAMIATGAYAKTHGLVANEWINEEGIRVNACDDDATDGCRVFSPTEKTGKSARALQAETLGSVCRRAKKPYRVIALSLKSRAAIPLAGPHGLPLWFDTKGGVFTSSEAFCRRLPSWVMAMNTHLANTLHLQEKTEWKPQFEETSPQYCYAKKTIYEHTGYPFSLIATPQPFTKPDGSRAYHLFEQTPQASRELFRLGLLAARLHHKAHPDKPLLLCISLSNFDYAGHYYGPESKEVIDMLYAIDAQLGHFIKKIEQCFGAQNCLWALTADHGVSQIPEVLKAEGNYNARRIDAKKFMGEINRVVYDLYNVKDLLKATLPPHFYVDKDKWAFVRPEKQKDIIAAIKNYCARIEGIADVWHATDFADPTFDTRYPKRSKAHWFKAQYMPGRSGDFVLHLKPHVQCSLYPKGTCHDSPYDLDTRVPVLFAGHGIQHGVCDYRVSMRHFAPTMAYLLEAPCPRHAPKKHWGSVLKKEHSLQSTCHLRHTIS